MDSALAAVRDAPDGRDVECFVALPSSVVDEEACSRSCARSSYGESRDPPAYSIVVEFTECGEALPGSGVPRPIPRGAAGPCAEQAQTSRVVALHTSELRVPLNMLGSESTRSAFSECGDICRICRVHDDSLRLFSPCLCRGTGGFVHEECLMHWINVSNKKADEMCCEICQFPYIVEYRTKPWKQWRRVSLTSTESRRLKIYLASYVIAGFTIGWTISSFLIPLLGANSTNFAFYFKLFLMIFCWLVWAVLFYLHGRFYASLFRKLRDHNRTMVILAHHEAV